MLIDEKLFSGCNTVCLLFQCYDMGSKIEPASFIVYVCCVVSICAANSSWKVITEWLKG
jgi:hypothetical protein